MGLANHLMQPGLADVSIALGGSRALVAKHFLDQANIHALVDQVGGEGMTQGVGSDFAFNEKLMRTSELACYTRLQVAGGRLKVEG